MVEMSQEFTRMMINEIESQFRQQLDDQTRMFEAFEELKTKVRPKMVVVKRELADVAKIFRDFQNKYEQPVFTKGLEFYLKALEYESKTVVDGLDEEIAFHQKEIDKLEQLKLYRIKTTQDCAEDITRGLIDQPQKMKERISLSE